MSEYSKALSISQRVNECLHRLKLLAKSRDEARDIIIELRELGVSLAKIGEGYGGMSKQGIRHIILRKKGGGYRK